MGPVILFPADPLNPRKVDSAYEREADAARFVGCPIAFVDIDHDPLDEDLEADKIGEVAIYRGWMMTPTRYQWFYEALWERGFRLINSPEEYRYCHELPQWYDDFKGATPKSKWFEPTPELGFELHDIATRVHCKLGSGPYIVKDYVKSRKHEWDEACFIRDGGAIEDVTRRFLELQGDSLAGGLVYRRFAPIRRVGTHPKSGAPIHNEIRSWTFCGAPLTSHTYWGPDEGGADITMPGGLISVVDLSGKGSVKQPLMGWRVKSNFYTMDLAEHEHGGWVIIELGDGQVSGLPEHVDAREFYRGLRDRFTFR